MARILDRKTIAIAALPDTLTFKHTLSSYVRDPHSATVNVVLTLEGGQYVGYIGYPHPSSLQEAFQNNHNVMYHCVKIHTFDQVARLGDKMDEDSKLALFPTVTPSGRW